MDNQLVDEYIMLNEDLQIISNKIVEIIDIHSDINILMNNSLLIDGEIINCDLLNNIIREENNILIELGKIINKI